MRAPPKLDLAARRRHQPHDRLHRRRLAGAVAAEQRHHLARPRLERDAVQDMGAAVIGVQVLHGEHGTVSFMLLSPLGERLGEGVHPPLGCHPLT